MLEKFATEAAKRRNARRRLLLRRSIRVVAVENGRSDLNGDSEERKGIRRPNPFKESRDR